MKHALAINRRSLIGAALLAPLAAHVLPAMAAPARKPNFLLIFPDQFRYDWLSGNPALPIHTPNLDRLAARGTRFAKAYCSSPICAPSRACLATGRDYDQCGVGGNWGNLPADRETYYKILRESGYWVASAGKLDLAKGEDKIGLDGKNHMDQWGFSDMVNCGGKGDAVNAWRKNGERPAEPYMAFLDGLGLAKIHADDIDNRGGRQTTRAYEYSQTHPTPLPDTAYEDNWVGQTGLDLLGHVPAGKPWHMIVNFSGPHDPMDITAAMQASVSGRRFAQPNESDQLSPEVHNAIRANYTAMVENIDRWVGRYVAELERRGELDNTIIVLSSDHGEMLGDHDCWAKNMPYEASTGVPLIVAGPGVRHQRSDALVSQIDIGATFLDIVGARRPEGMTAQSFRPLLEGRTRHHRDFAHSGLMNWRMVTDGRYKLIRGFDPATQHVERDLYGATGNQLVLFDLLNDPLENHDIAKSSPALVERLAKQLPPPNPDPSFDKPPVRARGGNRAKEPRPDTPGA